MKLFILLITLNFYQFCHKEGEVKYENHCYKLIYPSEMFNIELRSCYNHSIMVSNDQDKMTKCLNLLNNNIQKLIKIIVHNYKLKSIYKFSLFNYPSLKNSELWKHLITTMHSSYPNHNRNIFLNYYTENELLEQNEHPNVMTHEDTNTLINNKNDDKCIYGDQVDDNDLSFIFKYGECNKRIPFICMKPYQTETTTLDTIDGHFDVCSDFNLIEPGGNWVSCDSQQDNSSSFSHLSAIMCCMYNLDWQENFNETIKTCNKMNAIPYSLGIRGYKTILQKYSSFLDNNYANGFKTSDHSTVYDNFWTSCRFNSNSDLNKIHCNTHNDDNHLKRDEYDQLNSTQPKEDVKIIVIKVDNRSVIIGKPLIINLKTLLTIISQLALNETTNSLQILNKSNLCNKTDQIECLIQIFEIFLNEPLFVGRRNNIDSFIKTTINYKESKCFKQTSNYYDDNKKQFTNHFSLPFLNKCYHFSYYQLIDTPNPNLTEYKDYLVEQLDQNMTTFTIKKEVLSSLFNRFSNFDSKFKSKNFLINSFLKVLVSLI
jgi:hypothetical protein